MLLCKYNTMSNSLIIRNKEVTKPPATLLSLTKQITALKCYPGQFIQNRTPELSAETGKFSDCCLESAPRGISPFPHGP